jgi:signal transduction histidine kinase
LDTEPVVVMGNPDKLKQVFWNLAHNALRAMPGGGMLAIRAGRADDGSGRVIFRDDGVGISPDEKSQIFQPFHSGSSDGTGLGLSIVFQILEDHGGKIQVDSEKDLGTTVTVHLPAPGCDRIATR